MNPYQDLIDAAAALETCIQGCEDCNCDQEEAAFEAALIAVGQERDELIQELSECESMCNIGEVDRAGKKIKKIIAKLTKYQKAYKKGLALLARRRKSK